VDTATVERPRSRPAYGRQAAGGLPQARELAALGTVLCLHRARSGSALGGWAEAVDAAWHGAVESDGLRESLSFRNRHGQCCWRLYLLPDSDFLAWERLAGRLPREDCSADDRDALGLRLWRRLGERLSGDFWRAGVLRLRALPAQSRRDRAGPWVLAASLAEVSLAGMRVARRIAHREGAALDGAIDGCRDSTSGAG
jgi:hypothetical protein